MVRWLIGGSVFSALVLLIGTIAVSGSISKHHDDATSSFIGVTRIAIDSRDADVTIRRGGPRVTLHRRVGWSWARPVVSEHQVGGTLTVTTACNDQSGVEVTVNCAVSYEIEAPREVGVTASAERISITGLTGPLDLTASGPITVTGRPAALTAHSRAGRVDVHP